LVLAPQHCTRRHQRCGLGTSWSARLPAHLRPADADVVVVDSLKDAAVGLSEDEVGSGWNRAAQGLLATGRNLLVLHHRKKQTKDAKTGLDDVYGSTRLTSGMGSVVLLDGNPGDPLVEFRHLKFPVSEVGPMKVSHDQATGLMTVAEQVDLVTAAQAEGNITVKYAAQLLFGSASPSEVEKARRKPQRRFHQRCRESNRDQLPDRSADRGSCRGASSAPGRGGRLTQPLLSLKSCPRCDGRFEPYGFRRRRSRLTSVLMAAVPPR
jgi:hypothetical protein